MADEIAIEDMMVIDQVEEMLDYAGLGFVEGSKSDDLVVEGYESWLHIGEDESKSGVAMDRSSYLKLHSVLPFVESGYHAAIETIGDSMIEEEIIHVVDFPPVPPGKWVDLLTVLASSRPSIRFTWVVFDREIHAACNEAAQLLINHGHSLGYQNLEVFTVPATSMEIFLKMSQKEAVAVNLPYMLHRGLKKTKQNLLAQISGAKIVTCAEYECYTNTTIVDRLRACFPYYRALFDCIECLPLSVWEDEAQFIRVQDVIGNDIKNALQKNLMEPFCCWKIRFEVVGFTQREPTPHLINNLAALLPTYHFSYSVKRTHGAIMICWKGTPLASISVWTSDPTLWQNIKDMKLRMRFT